MITPRSGYCWTCGEKMDERQWAIAPREPSNHELRSCLRCHNAVEDSPDPLYVMNMIRYVAGISRVPPWAVGRS